MILIELSELYKKEIYYFFRSVAYIKTFFRILKKLVKFSLKYATSKKSEYLKISCIWS